MAVSKSSLSVGEIIYKILTEDAEVKSRVTKVFPVVTSDKAVLPYIVYRRAQMSQVAVKDGRGADMVGIEIICFTEHYTEGVELAEAVRDALDGVSGTCDGLTMRSCVLSDSEEAWQDDAYLQQLNFNIKL